MIKITAGGSEAFVPLLNKTERYLPETSLKSVP